MDIAIQTIYRDGVFKSLDITKGLAENQVLEPTIRPLRAVTSNPAVMGGKPCIAGTRMPIDWVFQFLEHGYTLEQFLQLYPQYRRNQIVQAIEYAVSTMGYSQPKLA